ncbi:AAA family ATPase [Sphingobium sp.]|uniref:AAA family ATPase n=1 Tax=Sphingobium sp. TaxID=1912891 RepID=UPI002BEDE749|nr:AAA family ATPase [Sphingobium sp.]HUD94523.1 AAA family ATPase [Sphingobium sp.]
MTPSFHILTGGPGSGKTSLAEALASRGLTVMQEAGRAIIRSQMAIGGNALPWADRAAFAEAMLHWELRSYEEAQRAQGPVLFDRGMPDLIGYLTLCGLPIPAHMRRACDLRRYHPTIFLAPHWPDIYRRDAERRQSGEEAEATCAVMRHCYQELGYRVVELPLVPVAERALFVLANIQRRPG